MEGELELRHKARAIRRLTEEDTLDTTRKKESSQPKVCFALMIAVD